MFLRVQTLGLIFTRILRVQTLGLIFTRILRVQKLGLIFTRVFTCTNVGAYFHTYFTCANAGAYPSGPRPLGTFKFQVLAGCRNRYVFLRLTVQDWHFQGLGRPWPLLGVIGKENTVFRQGVNPRV